jgi:hypothetical protein
MDNVRTAKSPVNRWQVVDFFGSPANYLEANAGQQGAILRGLSPRMTSKPTEAPNRATAVSKRKCVAFWAGLRTPFPPTGRATSRGVNHFHEVSTT